jgi:hypothetical protein
MSSYEELRWFMGRFSWYTALLTGGFGVCATAGTLHFERASQASMEILHALSAKANIARDASSAFDWASTATWVLLAIVFAGALLK